MRGRELHITDRKLCTESFPVVVADRFNRILGMYRCVNCNKLAYTLCDTCLRSITFALPTCCRCSIFSKGGTVHSSCIPNSSFYQKSISFFQYTKVIKRLFARYKFQRQFQYQRVIEFLVKQYFALDPLLALRSTFAITDRIALIPVPMHPRKESDRGFSPALELATLLSRQFCQNSCSRSALFVHIISKPLMTESQSSRTREKRLRSLQRSIQVSPKDGPEMADLIEFAPTKIVIVDDVLTTGATASVVIESLVSGLPDSLLNVERILLTFARSDRKLSS